MSEEIPEQIEKDLELSERPRKKKRPVYRKYRKKKKGTIII